MYIFGSDVSRGAIRISVRVISNSTTATIETTLELDSNRMIHYASAFVYGQGNDIEIKAYRSIGIGRSFIHKNVAYAHLGA